MNAAFGMKLCERVECTARPATLRTVPLPSVDLASCAPASGTTSFSSAFSAGFSWSLTSPLPLLLPLLLLLIPMVLMRVRGVRGTGGAVCGRSSAAVRE